MYQIGSLLLHCLDTHKLEQTETLNKHQQIFQSFIALTNNDCDCLSVYLGRSDLIYDMYKPKIMSIYHIYPIHNLLYLDLKLLLCQCMVECEGRPDTSQCQFECEMTLGLNNEQFISLLRCMAE